jgi:adenosylcobinamide-GDP ribazoletransferase
MRIDEHLARIVADIALALSLSTIFPVGPARAVDHGDMAQASWALPVAGLIVGLAGTIVYAIARKVGVPTDPAALLALATTILVTGAIHEDGLADTADGLGGGNSREQKLEIMRDSRIGSYGACALIVSILVRWSVLATIAEPAPVAVALLVSHAAARAPLPTLMWLIPPARSDGLSAGAGQAPQTSALVAAGLGFLCFACGFGIAKAMLGLFLLSLVGLGWAWLATRQVGGQTGDILGALEQLGEITVLLIAAAAF